MVQEPKFDCLLFGKLPLASCENVAVHSFPLFVPFCCCVRPLLFFARMQRLCT
uniref:Uncharacterized protein n=1 Tax=Arundo donax TaxID=35708 RepID=A0A0A9HH58_ARUDO